MVSAPFLLPAQPCLSPPPTSCCPLCISIPPPLRKKRVERVLLLGILPSIPLIFIPHRLILHLFPDSGGIGRSGAYCLIDMALNRIASGKKTGGGGGGKGGP